MQGLWTQAQYLRPTDHSRQLLDPERDTREKRLDYAEAFIPEYWPEYWIVNPLDETVTVLSLQGETYAEHGIYRRGERAGSALFDALAVDVAGVFDAALARP